ncbi:MAG: serine/threonine-protein phosphatase [Amphiamblys sp. WSBS2006]|nr:MAG: serine/threonine-protein phosphatase [Amphiamblys sp. WSBS2006]
MEELIEQKCLRGERIDEKDIIEICRNAIDVFCEEPTLLEIHGPVWVCGDLHGQLEDVCRIFELCGTAPAQKYVFLGDYVDRGPSSVETILLLLLYKIRYRDRVYLLRGNHECEEMTLAYGFYDECMSKYGSSLVWRHCCAVFNYLPISALVDGEYFCVHGGLSPAAPTLDSIRLIPRAREFSESAVLEDVLWGDPNEHGEEMWTESPRGAGYLFGSETVGAFHRRNGTRLLCRGHQLVCEGYRFHFQERSAVTVWSCTNYMHRGLNKAAAMRISGTEQVFFVVFGGG